MAIRKPFGLLLIVVCVLPVKAVGQSKYAESNVVNAACAAAPLPAPIAYQGGRTYYEKGPDTTALVFNINWSHSEQFSTTPPVSSLACDLKVKVYSSTEVDKMLGDLRGEVLNAVKAGVVQAAIKEDQLQSISETVQRSVEREIRAGLVREIAEIRKQLAALEQRLTAEGARQ